MEGRRSGLSAPAGIALLVIGCLSIGCAGEGGDGGGPPEPACTPTVDPAAAPRFAQNIQPIYNKSCAVPGCHLGPAPAQFLDLSQGKAYRATVNRRSTEVRSLLLVEPDDPDGSYLFQKIRGDPGLTIMPVGCDIDAPANGAVCLTADEIEAIRTWILACAPNN
jgi:hypothetical protein